jgi:hypothetical protein
VCSMTTTSTRTEPQLQRGVSLWLKTQAETVEAGVLVPALLFTEGDFVDGAGNKGSFNRADLNRIVRATKKYHGAGADIPLFESNHDLDGPYTNANKIGRLDVEAGLTVEEITEENLPDARFSDLIGRYGIFGHGLFTRTDAIERYQQTLIKPLSIAFDPSGQFTEGNKWAIFEVSAVPWGAVRGAMFFGKDLRTLAPGYKAALTLGGEIAEAEKRYSDPLDEKVGLLLMRFNEVLGAIRRTTDEELMGRDRNELTRQAIGDLGNMLTGMLGVTRPAPPPVTLSAIPPTTVDTLTGDSEPMTDNTNTATPAEDTTTPAVDMAALLTRIDALESAVTQQTNRAEEAEQVAQRLSFERQVSDRVTKLRNWAQKLVRLGKLTPAALGEWFPEQEEHSDAIVRFSKPAGDVAGAEAGTEQLDEIESALKYADKFVEPMKFGSAIGQQPLAINPSLDLDELPADAQSNIEAAVKASAQKRYY